MGGARLVCATRQAGAERGASSVLSKHMLVVDIFCAASGDHPALPTDCSSTLLKQEISIPPIAVQATAPVAWQHSTAEAVIKRISLLWQRQCNRGKVPIKANMAVKTSSQRLIWIIIDRAWLATTRRWSRSNAKAPPQARWTPDHRQQPPPHKSHQRLIFPEQIRLSFPDRYGRLPYLAKRPQRAIVTASVKNRTRVCSQNGSSRRV